MKYYLSQRGKQIGPWSKDEITDKLKSQHLSWTDYLYDETKSDWVLLMEHPEFIQQFKSEQAPPPVRPFSKKDQIILSIEKNWFILRGQAKNGPYSYVEVIKMLQDKKLYEFDFVWQQHWTSWKRVCEADEFRSEQIKALKDSGHPDVREIFYRRRHARSDYGASLVVHNNKSVWKGESLEISVGGASIILEHGDLHPGQSVFLHFKAGDGVPPFNAVCSIISKSALQGSKTHFKYGVKFTSISQDVQVAIKKFTDKVAA